MLHHGEVLEDVPGIHGLVAHGLVAHGHSPLCRVGTEVRLETAKLLEARFFPRGGDCVIDALLRHPGSSDQDSPAVRIILMRTAPYVFLCLVLTCFGCGWLPVDMALAKSSCVVVSWSLVGDWITFRPCHVPRIM